MTVYLENHSKSIKYLLELISEYSENAGCKVHILKISVVLQYNNNKQLNNGKSFAFAQKHKIFGIK